MMNGSNLRRTVAVLALAAAAFGGAGCQQDHQKQRQEKDKKFVAWYDRLGRKPESQQLKPARPVGMPGSPVTPGDRMKRD